MSNYFRITGYCPEKDFSFIMDSYGKFEKKWQFSAELVKRGFKIIEVSDDEQFLEGNIPLLSNTTDKFVLRAYPKLTPKKTDILRRRTLHRQTQLRCIR